MEMMPTTTTLLLLLRCSELLRGRQVTATDKLKLRQGVR